MTLVCTLPGLGFSPAIYQRLSLPSFSVRHLSWIEPHKKEPIADYAQRMIQQVDLPEEPIALIGHSFGGVMAQEIAKIRPVQKLVLASSVRDRHEVPKKFKILPPLGLHRMFNAQMAVATLPFWGPPLGYRTQEERALFVEMVRPQTRQYLQWALKALTTWEQEAALDIPTLHLHGTNDQTLPYRLIKKVHYTVPQGRHMMIFTEGAELSPVIEGFLKRG